MASEVPSTVIGLVERYDRNIDSYRNQSYNEAQVRKEFIDPFFEALGWDVANKSGYAEAYKDVIHEDAIKVGGITKAPDYCFRIGPVRKFFLEAKKPSVSIKDDAAPAYQLRRYAWSAKLPVSILTDFEEFAVYDCRVRPKLGDSPGVARIQFTTYQDYPERWPEIASVFSKEAVLQGSFDKYAVLDRGKRGTSEVDAEFLKEIEDWRDALARNLALRNPGLTVRELNFAVQRTIDRIVFLRMCEDRGVETYGSLQALLNGATIYDRLLSLYRSADDRYNSGLFHFQVEKGRAESPDALTPSLSIDDKTLKDIIRRLYYPESPYEFSVLGTDILGSVYEQFLGKVIRLTAGHRAVVEEKPEVKKAGGVYYTPAYIVDYIVQNTVGKLCDGKTPRQIGRLRILDPACGSGSFLIGAYEYLLRYHRDWYVDDGPEKHTKEIYQGAGGQWHLATQEKRRILLHNIFGVDIDSQAVEVTKLNLLLKVLEDENQESINQTMKMWHERALPDLGNNIKCGNSLIGPDYFRDRLIPDEDEMLRVNPFDWDSEFADIMRGGGFDVVIGNPPYVRQELLSAQKEYLASHYKTFTGTADLYVCFIERGHSLLNERGLFSYIVANKWMRANYGKPLRAWMKEQRIEEIVDFGDLPVFEKVTTYPCILRLGKGRPDKSFSVVKAETLDFPDLAEYVREHRYPVEQESLGEEEWSLADAATIRLLNKLRASGIPLGEYVNGAIYYGIKTGLNEAFVIDSKTREQLIAEDPRSAELIKPILMGRDIKRYRSAQSGKFLILIPSGWTRTQSKGSPKPWAWFSNNYPSIAKHLAPFERAAQRRWDKGEYWWELRPCDYYAEFEKAKIMFPDMSKRGNFILDETGHYCSNTAYIIASSEYFLLGLLNSKLMALVYQWMQASYRGGYLRFFTQYLLQLPIRDLRESSCREIENYARHMQVLQEGLTAAKTPELMNALQRQTAAMDKQIDQLVYELYGLTEEEIRIVEAAT